MLAHGWGFSFTPLFPLRSRVNRVPMKPDHKADGAHAILTRPIPHEEDTLGKPLISDTAMRSMYATMQHLRALKSEPRLTAELQRQQRALTLAQPESLHAALLHQMHRRDVLVTQGFEPLAVAALMALFADLSPSVHTAEGSTDECAAFAAGVARAKQTKQAAAGHEPVVIAFLRDFPALTAALRSMEKHNLSLLIVACGEAEGRADTAKRMHETKIPILPVDASDAVAVCRVVQESLLRARHGWGGAVIHAIDMPGVEDPIPAMAQRLKNRGLLPN